jgi:uncharacterized protein
MSRREIEVNEAELVERLIGILRATAPLMQVMRIARGLGLPDWLIFSGAIYQPVLNRAFEEPLRSTVEVRNQARVHVWFEGKFGEAYTPLSCTVEALV